MIKVCVCITTFNLEKYISTAIDSVLNQKVCFGYKILIADDCSTDRTIDILKDYKRKHSDLIELLLSDKNMGSLSNSNRLFDKIECEYFCFLDGDDYYINENMLQKQVDFLDDHPDYMLCAGNTQYLRDGILKDYIVKKNRLNKTYTFEDMLNSKMPFFHTSAIMLRNKIFCDGLPECYKNVVGSFEECAVRGEDFRRILHIEMGALYAMDEVFSVYRIHEKGLWQGSTEIRRLLESAIGWNFYRKYFGNKYGSYFEEQAKNSYNILMQFLIYNARLKEYYKLSGKDNWLFVSYLNELANNPFEEKVNQPKTFTLNFINRLKVLKNYLRNCMNKD